MTYFSPIKFARPALVLAGVCALTCTLLAPAVSGQGFATAYSFSGPDGSKPSSALVVGKDGALYGTTSTGGGASSCGTVFRVTNSGSLTTLYSFSGPDGCEPYSGLTLGADGNFYGTTFQGGASNLGTVFCLTSSGSALTTLHTFSGTDGANPLGPLTLAPDGSFYGTTSAGGSYSDGAIFDITSAGALTNIYSFSGPDGAAPYAGVVRGADGNFYGTTRSGGGNTYFGTVYKLTPGGSLSTLYSFGFVDGSAPYGSLVAASDGNLYGTTFNGGSSLPVGTIFRITPAGVLSTLHNFSGADGLAPESTLATGSDGSLYGATAGGGANGPYGTLFQLTLGGAFTSRYSFSRSDGANPTGALVTGTDGNLYGTTSGGGTNGLGTIFRLVPCPSCSTTSLVSSANPSAFGAVVTFTATVAGDSAGTPTGTVMFLDGSNPLGSAALTSGTAVLSVNSLTPGQHTITGSYSGDQNFQSSSGAVTQNVSPAPSSLSVSSNTSPVVFGQGVTLLGQVTPANASGTITFSSNSVILGSAPVSSGSASIIATGLAAGTDEITATYSGDMNYLGSIATYSELVNQAATTLGITLSASPVSAGQQITFSASITGQFAGSPTGVVTFSNNGVSMGSPAPVLNGQASLTYAFSGPCSCTVSASYSGDANFSPSNSSLTVAVSPNNSGSSLQTLYNFAGSDGSMPATSLTLASDGNFYGTTETGGVNSKGSVFRISPSGALSSLYSFAGSDGQQPSSSLAVGSDGKLYGSTAAGGANGLGTVFRIGLDGTFSTVYNFSGGDGASPAGAFAVGTDGNLYGSTSAGGTNSLGTVFQLTTTGTLTTLYNFSGADGATPNGLVLAADGNFYGTTQAGGLNGNGAIFQISSTGGFASLHSFSGSDGSTPKAGLSVGNGGMLYGTTSSGGANTFGGIFSLTPGGAFTTLYNFAGHDGSSPCGTLLAAPDGSFYGATSGGSTNGLGGIFSISPAGQFTLLYGFSGPDGAAPQGAVILGADGNLYGTTSSGGLNNQGSIFRFPVVPAFSQTVVAPTANPAAYGAAVSFNVTVSAFSGTSTPTGSAMLLDGNNSIGTANLIAGTASISAGSFTPGTHAISVIYSGDSNFKASSAAISEFVGLAAAVVGVSSSMAPSTYGQSLTFSATVGSASGLPNSTGTVAFTDGSNSLGSSPIASGLASVTAPLLSGGTHNITASYSGDANYSASSATLAQVVNLEASTTKASSSLSPSQLGQTVMFSATVGGSVGTPTGMVTFSDGGTVLGSVPLASGAASFSSSALTVGTHSISIAYAGDGNFQPSSASLSQVVTLASTVTSVTSSKTPATYGQTLTFSATVSAAAGAPPVTGTVTFTAGATNLVSAPVSGGMASVSAVLPAGTQTVTASYGGSSTLQASSGTVVQSITQATSSVTLSSSLNPANVNASVVFKATVSGQYAGTPTGSVTIYQSGSKLGSATLSNGQASLSKAFSNPGTYTMTAVYSGDSNFVTSTSAG